ncbi:hypothetical protein HED60_21740 [Planctomycetales bacterium ZRK34]|nr:hypothetical protein HED60_21740 [Planctomycetales bacterium ZRK34]
MSPSLRHLCVLCALCGFIFLSGCQNTRPGRSAAADYYDHAYPAARDTVRVAAADRKSNNVVLDNMRLGLASMADGDLDEAERALLRAYEYLRSGGVNTEDRTIASEWISEGVKVWKGEPYEQAMSYYYISALYMVRGDWENARAAAQNALFALRDFGDYEGQPRDMKDIVTEAAKKDQSGGDYLGTGYRPIESQFTLGYLMAATSYVLMKQPDDATRMFEHVKQLRPELSTLVDTLAAGQFDTLLIIDAGHGPRKQAYGPDNALVRYVPDGRRHQVPTVSIVVDSEPTQIPTGQPVVDLWTLSQYPKWWSLESMRQAKSAIGNVLLIGGLGAAQIGSQARSEEAVYAGLAAAALGALMKAGSAADTRHLAMLPRCTYIVPLRLGAAAHNVTVLFDNDPKSNATWHDLAAGATGNPRVYYLRHHDAGGRGMPPWPADPLYSVSVEAYKAGDRPYVLGGKDLTPPSQALMQTYHAAGVLPQMSLDDLMKVYNAEGIVYRTGPQGRDAAAGGLDPDLYRHITAGGRVLYVPYPGTHGYERITRIPHAPYSPRSDLLRHMMNTSAVNTYNSSTRSTP